MLIKLFNNKYFFFVVYSIENFILFQRILVCGWIINTGLYFLSILILIITINTGIKFNQKSNYLYIPPNLE